MENCLVGRIVESMCGHDVGKRFLVVSEDELFVYLSDGKTKTLDGPKRKKRKHVTVCEVMVADELTDKLKKAEKVYDHEIIRALKIANK